jgi:hypothetical protein
VPTYRVSVWLVTVYVISFLSLILPEQFTNADGCIRYPTHPGLAVSFRGPTASDPDILPGRHRAFYPYA